MKIAIFGRTFNKDFNPFILEFLQHLQERNIELYVYKPFHDYIVKRTGFKFGNTRYFNGPSDAPGEVDFFISIGGDGTFLESIVFLKNYSIPVIGLNSGRLGFLANISKEEISEALDAILGGNFELEKRSLLILKSEAEPFEKYNFALNDATIQKKDTNLITIDTYLDKEFLNTYWTDGLIISTPTGSTAYCMSAGGPIVLPGSENFVLAPIASHNLTVRPLVIPDTMEIKLEVTSRCGNFLVSVDNRTAIMDTKDNIFYIRKAPFQLKMVKLPFNNYYSTLRNKLMWGADIRN
jgi:NAD+ kinase